MRYYGKGGQKVMQLKLSILLIVLILVFSVPAVCREPVTLTLYNIWGGSRIPLMEKQLQRFEEKYPWITVKNEVGGHDLIEQQALVAIAAGNPPDVLMIDRLQIPAFVDGGLILPLDRYIDESGLDLSIFYPAEIGACQYKGHTYTLPMPSASLSLLYYNRDMFAEAGLDPDRAPVTWKEMTDYARRLHRTTPDGTVAVSGASINYFPRHRMAQLAYCNGATIFGENPLDVDYLESEVQEAAAWASEFVSQFQPTGSVQQGNRAMETNGEWVYFYIKEAAPELDVGIGLVPHGPRGEYQNLVAAAWSYGIPQGVKHPYESWLLVEFLTTSEEGAKYFTIEQARPSPVREFTMDPAYWDLNPNWGVIGQALERSANIPPSPVAGKIIAADIRWYGALMAGNESPGNALEKLQNEVQSIINDYLESR